VLIVLQRVARSAVRVDGAVVGSIDEGLLLLVGIERSDTVEDIDAAADKVAHLRVFADSEGQMNRSLLDVGGSALVVSQFTLLGDIRKGRRPSFSGAASPEKAAPMVAAFVEALRGAGIRTETGVFGARMEVELVNDGPVTLLMEVRSGRVSP
jgi:D-tyrosyl-tRNA(Tyr) deacylase